MLKLLRLFLRLKLSESRRRVRQLEFSVAHLEADLALSKARREIR